MRKVVRPYEILVRFHADGSIAAHIGEIVEIYDDDETLLASRELPVRPLAMAGAAFDAAMKHVDRGLLHDNRGLLHDNGRLSAEVEHLRSEAATLVNAVENERMRAKRAEHALADAMHPSRGFSSFVPQVTPGGGG